MKNSNLLIVFSFLFILSSCATGYQTVPTKQLTFASKNENQGVIMEYKYDYLTKKYANKQYKKGIKVVAVKIVNNSDKDLVFGENFSLSYANGIPLNVLGKEEVYQQLKQNSATYLLYLLLTPMRLETYETNSYGYQETTSSTPIGYVVGPGVAATNVIISSEANKKFREDLNQYLSNGQVIKRGETFYGLIGIRASSFDQIIMKL